MSRIGALRYFAEIKNGTTPASGEPSYWDGEVAWATPDDLGRLTGTYISETKRAVTPLAVAENNLNLVPVDTVLMSTRAPIGHMAIAARPLTFNQGCRALIPHEGTWGPYLFYLLKSRVPELNASANGTTFVELSRDELAAVRVSLPAIESQKRIAIFLDEKTAQIDGLIAKKRALLLRLAEKRRAIITEAVTKGLNPVAPMKDSGIDWLGQIPAHWETKRLKFITSKIGSGVTPRGGSSVYVDEGVMLLRSQNIHFDGLQLNDVAFIDPETDAEMSETRVLEGDILLNITGASIGRCCVYDRSDLSANVNQHVCIIRPTPVATPNLVSYFLASPLGQFQIDHSQNGASREGLNFGDLGNFLMPVPNRAEQDEIADFLGKQISISKLQRSKIIASINNLVEYRSALITAAITGQIEGLR